MLLKEKRASALRGEKVLVKDGRGNVLSKRKYS